MAAAVVAGVAVDRVAVAADAPAPRLRAAGGRVAAQADLAVVAVVRAGRPGRRRGVGRPSAEIGRLGVKSWGCSHRPRAPRANILPCSSSPEPSLKVVS